MQRGGDGIVIICTIAIDSVTTSSAIWKQVSKLFPSTIGTATQVETDLAVFDIASG